MRHTGFSNEHTSGSTFVGEKDGGVLMILNRHHDCAKVGMWLVNFMWYANDIRGYHFSTPGINAIVDDYGNLVPMHNRD